MTGAVAQSAPLPASMAGLPANRARVLVDPPWFPRALSLASIGAAVVPSRLLGRYGDAKDRLERALEMERGMNAPPFQARSEFELASVLKSAGGRENVRRATSLRAAAAATVAAIGAPGIRMVVGEYG